MAKRAIALRVLIIVLLAFGASAILPAVEAYGSMHAKSGGGQYDRMTSPDKETWATKGSEPSLLAASSVSALVVLVALLAAVIIYRERK